MDREEYRIRRELIELKWELNLIDSKRVLLELDILTMDLHIYDIQVMIDA